MSKYIQVYDPTHPLAHKKSEQVFEHRAILFDHIGNDGITCTYCNRPLDWFGITGAKTVVDHVDNDPRNNDTSNLVPSCNSCNVKRAPSWNHAHRLDDTRVRIVRHYIGQGKSSAWVALLNNVSRPVIGRLKRNETYRRVV